MKSEVQAYTLAINEINEMLSHLNEASVFEEHSTIKNFLLGFCYGQFKQEILNKESYEAITFYIEHGNSEKPNFLIFDEFDEELQNYADNMVLVQPKKESFFRIILNKIFK